MKTLVVYYSRTGNVRYVATVMARELEADLQALKPLRDIPARGFRMFWNGGCSVLRKQTPGLHPLQYHPAAYDLVLFGTPVWVGTFAPAMRTFFKMHRIQNKRIAFFCCHGGRKGRIFERMRQHLAGNEFAGEIDFKEPLKGDVAAVETRTRQWAASLRPAT